MKRNKVYPTAVLCDTMVQISVEEVQNYNLDNETEYNEEELIHILREEEIENFFSNLESSEFIEDDVVILGVVGLWDGRHTITPVICSALDKAIYKCISSGDDYKITQKNGRIFIDVYHHDGINNFEIKFLNNRGLSCKYGDITKKYYHKRMKGYLF